MGGVWPLMTRRNTPLARPTGPPYWPALLARPTGPPYWTWAAYWAALLVRLTSPPSGASTARSLRGGHRLEAGLYMHMHTYIYAYINICICMLPGRSSAWVGNERPTSPTQAPPNPNPNPNPNPQPHPHPHPGAPAFVGLSSDAALLACSKCDLGSATAHRPWPPGAGLLPAAG